MSGGSASARRWPRWFTARRVLLATLAVATLAGVWAFFIEPNRLVVRHESITPPRWPAALDGTRIVVLTDLHVGAPHIGVDKLTRVVDETNAADPDLVLILGDLVIQGVVGGDFVEPEVIAEELSRLSAKHGVFAVLGNHDWWHNGSQIRAALEAADIVVLEDHSTSVQIGEAQLYLAGVSDLMTRDANIGRALEKVPAEATTLLITHNPDIFPDVPEHVELSLAGHTHGGQVCLPVVGAPVVPSRFGQRYVRGHIVEEGRHLYVGVGVGTSILPVRFGVPPAIDVLTLRSPESNPGP